MAAISMATAGVADNPGDAQRAFPPVPLNDPGPARPPQGPSRPRDDTGPDKLCVASPAPARAAFPAAARGAAWMYDAQASNMGWADRLVLVRDLVHVRTPSTWCTRLLTLRCPVGPLRGDRVV